MVKMGRDYREEALKLEKNGRKQKNPLLYEQSGDNWLLQAFEDKEKSYQLKMSDLSNAINSYKHAAEIVEGFAKQSSDRDYQREMENFRNNIYKSIQKVQKAMRKLRPEGKNLTSKLQIPAIISISTLLASLIFVSSSITGNAIAGIPANNLRWVGLCFFACGLVFAFILLKKKNKKF